MSERATCWSITINNPTEQDMSPTLPAGWKQTGQVEQGEEGTTHYQGMVTTPQVRFSALKKVYPRAHIEIARNRAALAAYVHKDETRVQAVADRQSNIPTLFDYQHTIAKKWNDDEWNEFQEQDAKRDLGDLALDYVDMLVARDIREGICGVEYIAINPMWRSAWKKFWRSMIARERISQEKSESKEEE